MCAAGLTKFYLYNPTRGEGKMHGKYARLHSFQCLNILSAAVPEQYLRHQMHSPQGTSGTSIPKAPRHGQRIDHIPTNANHPNGDQDTTGTAKCLPWHLSWGQFAQ